MNTKPPKIEARCNHCGQNFMQSRKIAVKNKRLGFNSYCSKSCQHANRSTKKAVECAECGKAFKKLPKEIAKSKNDFCSSSCSAKFNNRKRVPKYNEPKICNYCKLKPIKSYRANFCSYRCASDYKIFERIKSGKFSAQTAKKYLKLKSNKCSICGQVPEWNNKKLIMILDHIDGNSNNNDLSNLRLVCPNCDTQLPTYKSKNKGSGRHYRRERYKLGKSY